MIEVNITLAHWSIDSPCSVKDWLDSWSLVLSFALNYNLRSYKGLKPQVSCSPYEMYSCIIGPVLRMETLSYSSGTASGCGQSNLLGWEPCTASALLQLHPFENRAVHPCTPLPVSTSAVRWEPDSRVSGNQAAECLKGHKTTCSQPGTLIVASPEGWVAAACWTSGLMTAAAAQLSPRVQLGDGTKHLMASLRQQICSPSP